MIHINLSWTPSCTWVQQGCTVNFLRGPTGAVDDTLGSSYHGHYIRHYSANCWCLGGLGDVKRLWSNHLYLEGCFPPEPVQYHWFGYILGGGFKCFLCSPLPGEMIQIDEHIFQRGWFNHQPVYIFYNLEPVRDPLFFWMKNPPKGGPLLTKQEVIFLGSRYICIHFNMHSI